ncbi:hypothetical protein H6P81_003553 [Aristolochia fimbriata]|uniref:RING-type domain-containing protein n=1 Tax=Aristolochia fimbriata TaxID=158543 RepID=A0AAV7FCX6_ARIFI|nr:hypothetical protein H6P81_003553 [Aristolochia fimbriata]
MRGKKQKLTSLSGGGINPGEARAEREGSTQVGSPSLPDNDTPISPFLYSFLLPICDLIYSRREKNRELIPYGCRGFGARRYERNIEWEERSSFNWGGSLYGKEAMIASGINLAMTVIGFAVSTMFIVFVCTRLICARIQLNASRRSFPTATRSDLSLLERGLHGLEPFVVATFPTKKFSDEYFSSAEDTQCTVCLAEYQGKDILRILPYCGHTFHVTCIDIWLQQNSTCPVCRISLRDSPERKRMLPPMFSSALRSAYNETETFDSRSYHYVYNSPGYSSRTQNNHRMESIQEDNNCTPDLVEAMEPGDVSAETECNRVRKDVSYECSCLSQCKHVESPSAP